MTRTLLLILALSFCPPATDLPPTDPPGRHDSWTTRTGFVWTGRRWYKPMLGRPRYPLRPVMIGGLWNHGIPYDHPMSRDIQDWERMAAEYAGVMR